MTTSSPKLEIIGLTKDYKGAVALKPTDLIVKKGEFLTLLGPSGSGKTTLLMMVAGLTEPSGGRIRVDGEDITTRPAFARNLGVVFQNYALFPHMSVRENVAFPLRMRRMSEPQIDAAVRDALAIVRLEHLSQRLPAELSGGQQQRVAFARAIVFKPALVLMDEPLGALDKKLRDELKAEIRTFHRTLGATILYVTHDQDEAMMLSDRICLMNHAQVVQVDTPAVLYNRPQSEFAAEFIGESNLLTARVRRIESGRAEMEIAGMSAPLFSAHAEGLQTGAPTRVLIRPERIAVVDPTTPTQPNQFDAVVQTTLDLGGLHRVVFRLADGSEIKAALLGRARMAVNEGQSVRLSVDAEDVVPLAPAALAEPTAPVAA